MAITVNFNGASLRRPGAYSQTTVNLTGGFPLAATGVVGIVGEAEGGAPGSSDGVQTFTSEDIAALVAKYKSGPIVDAAKLLIAPARDNRVPNGASIIRVYKVNSSSQATSTLANAAATDVFNLTSANYGESENLISVQVNAGSSADQKILVISRGSATETLSENTATTLLSLQYTGADAACTATIQDISGVKTLSLSTGSTPAEDLTVSLAGKTIQDVVDIVNNFGGTPGAIYTASSALQLAGSTSATRLDYISTAADVKTASVDLKGLQQELLDIIATESQLVTATQIANVEGIPDTTLAKKFLQGAVRGSANNTSFQSGFDALLTTRCNTVVPLLSRDAANLASEGLTDPASTYTVDAVNLQAVTHCVTASNTKNRSERNAYVSVKRSFALSQDAARTLQSERASMLFQDVQVTNSEGNIVTQEPWASACILAGIQSGTEVGTPATFKFINALGIAHQDYNQQTQADLAIDAGLLPLEEPAQGGFRVLVHNTTYGVDANFVFNRAHVLEAADFVAFNLRQQLEAIFVGNKVTTTLAIDVRDTVVSIMETFLNNQIIVGDDTNNGLGFKDLVVTVNGNIVEIDIVVTPVVGVDFILSRITLDTIRQSA